MPNPTVHRVSPWTWFLGAAVLIPSILGFANKFLDLMIVAAGDDEGAFALTPIMNYLLATAGFFCMLMWAVTQGAFHDIDEPSHVMFENELELERKSAEGLGPRPRFSFTHHSPEFPMTTTEHANAELEGQNHTYAGHAIPWYVRLIWLAFWVFAISYVVMYLLPALQTELLTPP